MSGPRLVWRSSQDEAAIIDQGVQKVEYVVPASASTQTARMLPPRAESTASQSAIGIEKHSVGRCVTEVGKLRCVDQSNSTACVLASLLVSPESGGAEFFFFRRFRRLISD